MNKLMLIAAGIILAASATVLAVERMDASGMVKRSGISIEIHGRR